MLGRKSLRTCSLPFSNPARYPEETLRSRLSKFTTWYNVCHMLSEERLVAWISNRGVPVGSETSRGAYRR